MPAAHTSLLDTQVAWCTDMKEAHVYDPIHLWAGVVVEGGTGGGGGSSNNQVGVAGASAGSGASTSSGAPRAAAPLEAEVACSVQQLRR